MSELNRAFGDNAFDTDHVRQVLVPIDEFSHPKSRRDAEPVFSFDSVSPPTL
jgi:hypothetical protein